MINNSIERMLELNNRIEKGNVAPKQGSNGGQYIKSQSDLDALIENYDRQVYGPTAQPILKEGETEVYDAKKEWNHLKEIEANGGRGAVDIKGKNIPRDILESVLNNPLDLKPIDPRMDAFENKLKNNMPGIKAAANILERVEKQDKEAKSKLNENIIRPQQTNASIDYEAIRNIVEETITKKLSEINETLNESAERSKMYVPSMKLLNFKDKFYFVDNDDNVFECEMKYKGKRKKQ